MSCLLVTPNEELLFDEAISQTRPLSFNRLSMLLKIRSKELMAKLFGFFRKSNDGWDYDTVIETEESSLPIGLPSVRTLMSNTSIRKMDWSIEEPCTPCAEAYACNEDEEIDGWEKYYDENCNCTNCREYREVKYSVKQSSTIDSKPTARKRRSAVYKPQGDKPWYYSLTWLDLCYW